MWNTCPVSEPVSEALTGFAPKDISKWHGARRSHMRIMKRLHFAAALFCALPLAAHHAVSAEFNAEKVITLKGVVSKVDWVNPHIFIYVDVKDESGKVTTWSLQSLPPMFFKNSGLSKTKLLDGVEATVNAYPAKVGTNDFWFLLKPTHPT